MLNFYIKQYFSIENSLHPTLLNNLSRRGYLPLKPFQEEAINIVNNNRNVFINSCTGSGKTLAYLVPIMNRLFQKKQQKQEEQQQHGGLILTLNKELVGQIYNQAKKLDIQNQLEIFRTGSFNQIKDISAQDDPTIKNGLTNHVVWKKIDLLISTPQALTNYLKIFKTQRNNTIDPEFLSVDEADLLLELDKNVSRNTDSILRHIRTHSTNSANIKYLLTASSFPKKYKGHESISTLKQNFKVLECIDGIDKHKLPQNLDLYYIEMQQKKEEKLEAQKKYFIQRILGDRKTQRIIIFCKQKLHIQMLHSFIKEELQQEAEMLYAELKTEERTAALDCFSRGAARILICSELGSRGLDFSLPVDCIIEYDMAQNVVHFINRAGRTARNGLKGEVITFVQQKNKAFFDHLKTLKTENEQFDELFSRKRSYSKLYKADNSQ